MNKAIEIIGTIRREIGAFRREEDGVALTEYLVLLALLVGGVVGAVTIAGEDLSDAWTNWGSWWTDELGVPAT